MIQHKIYITLAIRTLLTTLIFTVTVTIIFLLLYPQIPEIISVVPYETFIHKVPRQQFKFVCIDVVKLPLNYC